MATQVFSYEYWEIFKNTYFEEHLQMVAFNQRGYIGVQTGSHAVAEVQ